MKRKLIATGLAVAFATTSFGTLALADAADDAIKARQSYYQVIKFNFAQVVAMAKGEAEYNAEAAANAAKNLKTMTTIHVPPMYPPGSDNVAKKGKTRALPKIWEDFPGVGKKAGEWKGAVDNLVKVAANGKDALGPAVGAVGKTCAACHDAYRAKNF